MALESFGTDVAVQIDHAVKLCHDLLKENSADKVNQIFKASDPDIWWVRADTKVLEGSEEIVPIVVVELGVG